MLKRIYIDNFRCFVNFELAVDSINLLLGDNGAGKSTVFDVLRKIQAFVRGDAKVNDIFDSANCTRWQTSPIQSFELEIEGNDGTYKYELAIEHLLERHLSRVLHERLWFDKQPLLKVELGEVQLNRDDYSQGSNYNFDWSQSVLPLIMSRNDNTKLTWFKERMERFIIVQIIPSLMVDDSDRESTRLSPKMENFASWYRHISQDQGKAFEITNALREIFDGFAYFKFTEAGESNRILKVCFSATKSGKYLEYKLRELSDGYRAIIALYSLIYYTQSGDFTLCLDEPENFLALAEIQPWLIQLYDLCTDDKIQALLISHHPEMMNYLLGSPVGYWFARQSHTPTRVKPFSDLIPEDIGANNASELIARGWIDG
ncbi:MAG: AAA family ATPase [Cyanobacteriota bacterium]|nr:AAA family ATPase [Cyanobacteriota bacterium]